MTTNEATPTYYFTRDDGPGTKRANLYNDTLANRVALLHPTQPERIDRRHQQTYWVQKAREEYAHPPQFLSAELLEHQKGNQGKWKSDYLAKQQYVVRGGVWHQWNANPTSNHVPVRNHHYREGEPREWRHWSAPMDQRELFKASYERQRAGLSTSRAKSQTGAGEEFLEC